MQDEIFADAIGQINIANNVVRIDLVSLSATELDSHNNPKAVFRQRVVMPLDAFGHSADLINKVINDLVTSGALRHETQADSSKAGPQWAPGTASACAQTTTGNFVATSPNFSQE